MTEPFSITAKQARYLFGITRTRLYETWKGSKIKRYSVGGRCVVWDYNNLKQWVQNNQI